MSQRVTDGPGGKPWHIPSFSLKSLYSRSAEFRAVYSHRDIRMVPMRVPHLAFIRIKSLNHPLARLCFECVQLQQMSCVD